MCAIAGIGGPVADKAQRLAQSCRRLAHRGPDSHGFWEDRQVDLALAHVWLAILDLSPAGHQPMVSACERYVLVLNGEIYNHMALCHRLAQSGLAPAWCGHSDTETVLACPAALGVQATLQACVGIFAFALWDRATQTLSMARESLGEKPLYYGFTGGALVFGSEIKALASVPGFGRNMSRKALKLLMRHNDIPAPWSIYDGIFKLPPGTWLSVSGADIRNRHLPAPRAYWSAIEAADTASASLSLAAWLRGPLAPWADALLDEKWLREQGLFAPAQIVRKWQVHRRGHRDWASHLWGVLMAQAWIDRMQHEPLPATTPSIVETHP